MKQVKYKFYKFCKLILKNNKNLKIMKNIIIAGILINNDNLSFFSIFILININTKIDIVKYKI